MKTVVNPIEDKAAFDNHKPKTVREQIYYIIGRLNSMEQDRAGCVNVNHNMLIEQLEIALHLAESNKISDTGYTYRPPFPAQKGIELEPLKGEKCNY